MINTKVENKPAKKPVSKFPILMQIAQREREGMELIVMFTEETKCIVLHARNCWQIVGDTLTKDDNIVPFSCGYWKPFSKKLVMQNS